MADNLNEPQDQEEGKPLEYERKLYPDLDLSTPEKMFAAIEKATGHTLDAKEKVMIVITVLQRNYDVEGVYAVAIHDCQNCPIYDKCDQEHKKPRDDDHALEGDIPAAFLADDDKDQEGEIPEVFRLGLDD